MKLPCPFRYGGIINPKKLVSYVVGFSNNPSKCQTKINLTFFSQLDKDAINYLGKVCTIWVRFFLGSHSLDSYLYYLFDFPLEKLKWLPLSKLFVFAHALLTESIRTDKYLLTYSLCFLPPPPSTILSHKCLQLSTPFTSIFCALCCMHNFICMRVVTLNFQPC